MDKRERVVSLVGDTLRRKRLMNIEKARSWIETDQYHRVIESEEWDFALRIFIEKLGLQFALICEDLQDYQTDTTQNNKPLPVKLWSRQLKNWNKDIPSFPEQPFRKRISVYIDEINELRNQSGLTDKTILNRIKYQHGLPDTSTLEFCYGDDNYWIGVAQYKGARTMFVLDSDDSKWKTTSMPKLKEYVRNKIHQRGEG